MQRLTFPYIPNSIINPKTQKVTGTIFRPQIPIRLSYNRKIVPFPIDCLVDSGADVNLFPVQWGQIVGIDIMKGIYKHIIGIGNSKMEAYTHRVKLYIGSHSINVEVDFGLGQQVPLLGRNGFFSHFQEVKFLESQKKVILSW